MKSHCVVQMATNTCLYTTEKSMIDPDFIMTTKLLCTRLLIRSDIKYSGCFYLWYFCWSKSSSCILDSQHILLNQLPF